MSATKAQTAHTQSAKAATTASVSSDESSFVIVSADNWDVKKHKCGMGKPNKSGQGRSAALSYSGGKFYLKTPKMNCPFGASKPQLKKEEKERENPQWSLQMSFNDDPACQAFLQKVSEFDEYIVDEAMKPENQVSWLGHPKTKMAIREVVSSKYTYMLKHVKTKEGEISTQYPPFIRVNFPTTYKAPYQFTCEVYDRNNELQDVSPNPSSDNCINRVIPPNSQVSALLVGNIWSTDKGFGVTWKVQQLKVFPPRGLPKGKCLVSDPEDDVDQDETDSSGASSGASSGGSATESKSSASKEVADPSDDDASEVTDVVEEEVEVPQPKPKAPAKRVTLAGK